MHLPSPEALPFPVQSCSLAERGGSASPERQSCRVPERLCRIPSSSGSTRTPPEGHPRPGSAPLSSPRPIQEAPHSSDERNSLCPGRRQKSLRCPELCAPGDQHPGWVLSCSAGLIFPPRSIWRSSEPWGCLSPHLEGGGCSHPSVGKEGTGQGSGSENSRARAGTSREQCWNTPAHRGVTESQRGWNRP